MGELTVTDIARRVRRQMGDEAGVVLTDQTVYDWINDGMREIVLENDLLRWRATTNSVAGQANYAIPTDLLRFHSITYGGEALTEISLQDAQKIIPNIDDTTTYAKGTPQQFWQYGNEFFLYPAPASIKTIVIYYNRRPTPVTDLGNTPELSARYDNRLVEYCLAQAAEMDDNDTMAVRKRSEFQEGLSRSKDEESESGLYPHMGVSIADSYGYSYYDYL